MRKQEDQKLKMQSMLALPVCFTGLCLYSACRNKQAREHPEPLCLIAYYIIREEELGGEYLILIRHSANISSKVSGLCTQWTVLCLLYSQWSVHPQYWMFFPSVNISEKITSFVNINFKTKQKIPHFHTQTEIVY